MSSFSFIVTEECDWGCQYCHFSNISKQRGPKLETFQKHLPYIKPIIDKLAANNLLVHIDIQGGEPGVLPIEILRYFFQTLQRPIAVSTNGEFLRRGYHKDKILRPYMSDILWHVSNDFKTKLAVDYNDDQFRISKGIVHDNIDEIVEYVKMNDHIMFDYIEFEFDIKEDREMNLAMYKELMDKIKCLKNITDNAKGFLHRRFIEKPDHRDNCKNLNGTMTIDMVNETICLCQRHPDVTIPLNQENLIRRLTGFPKDIWSNANSCSSCTRLYAGKFYGNVIERWLNIRRLQWK